jgi:hypothetical protein
MKSLEENSTTKSLSIKTISWNLQAVDKISIWYGNGDGWNATISYFVDGMRLEKNFFDETETLEEKIQEIKDFILKHKS